MATALPIRKITSIESTDRRNKVGGVTCMHMSIHIYVVSGCNRVGDMLCICMAMA